jgi:hypothetical protein
MNVSIVSWPNHDLDVVMQQGATALVVTAQVVLVPRLILRIKKPCEHSLNGQETLP